MLHINNTNGFVRLHRSILDRWAFPQGDPYLFSVWVHLLLMAEHKDIQDYKRTLHRGEVLISLRTFSEYTGVSVQRLRTCLRYLERNKKITRETTNGPTTRMTLIRILQYDKYQ